MNSVEHFIEKFVPENYNIFLDINRQEKTFSGNVAISGEALNNQVSFHQKDLAISSVLLDNQPVEFELDQVGQAVHLNLPETGSMTLVLEFSGKITDNMTGIYPSYYSVDGVKKEVLATQFESHFAREAFPSIDEPEAKATFDLAIKFDQVEGDLVISNMPETNVQLRQDTGVWTFETTPRMSSYLLAFALGDLQAKKGQTKNGTEVGIFATKAHKPSSLDFALDIAVRVIDFYEDYYGVAYPIPHSYHLALPDFSAGAMENWGLVTYREIYLIVDENSTAETRQQVALVIAHELAHQWFGNLVTMKWWDDLWLNESFANMMEYVSIDAIEPTWNIFEDFQTTGVPLALKRDATDGVQSVHVAVNHPDEINTLFDPAIVYAKGSRLMHMLRRWLGDKDFAAGLKAYFEKHQYRNTIGRDLWNALSASSDKDVASFMDAWLEQPGYPLVTAQVLDDNLILSQKQFFIGDYEEENRLWQIPLNSNWSGLPDTLSQASLTIPNYSALAAQNEGALRLNTGNTAHYITNYQGQLLDGILNDFAELDKTSKLQVLQERRLLAESGEISYADLVPLLTMLSEQTSYMVSAAGEQIISGLNRFIDEGSDSEQNFKQVIKMVAGQNFARLGFEKRDGEADEDEMVRQSAIRLMLKADDETVIAGVHEIFQAYQNQLESIPAAIRASVLNNEMKHAETPALVQEYLDAYVTSTDGIFKRQLSNALSNTKDQASLTHILTQWQNKDVVKPQDLATWYAYFLQHSFTQMEVWNWSKENWEWIKSALGGDMSFDKFVIYPSNYFKTEEALADYKTFFEPKLDDMAISRNITMGIKEIAARVALIQQEKAAVEVAIDLAAK
ncbi:M1 family metallopeptidase [Streptococcus sobrinus]|uniref:Aminopeptidase n=1 Tax=Streptococcus sobrinus TaxID=1310 RepID=A0ABM6W4B3_9STRE|nr:M1 family metallopeptidase [Streptococcus sobrinus]AWN20621.1 aminopeptidase [Streptococcus sobrinus]EMP71941.1 aminopeptidase N [Streptococcus sobrinus DSM 20742 = ATCC 33478]SQG13373.1 aminopeptidase N [Streptococcus sobrinus]